MCDPVNKVVAAVHAGWRGTAKRIAAKTAEYFTRDFGSKRDDIRVAIGPAIAGECYEVDDDVAESMITCAGEHLKRGERPGKWYVDLKAVNKKILADIGIQHIDVINICNHCDPRFASYRRNRSEEGRQVNFICLA
jgi:YfiH family protein